MAVAGFRCFLDEVEINGFQRVNKLIGQNNVGKSTLLMPLRRLTRFDERFVPRVAQPDGVGRLGGEHTIRLFPSDSCGIPAKIRFTLVVPGIGRRVAQFYCEHGGVPMGDFSESDSDVVEIEMIEYDRGYVNFHFSRRSHELLKRSHLRAPMNKAAYQESLTDQLAVSVIGELAERIVYVPPLRQVLASSGPPDETSYQERRYDGAALYTDLLTWYLPDSAGRIDPQRSELLNRFCSRVLGHNVNVWPQPDGYVAIAMGNESPRSLAELGLGVSQVVVVGAAIVGAKQPPVLLLEEPEICLHPGLQRALIRELAAYDRIQVFITTHSNHFVDQGGGGVYHVRLSGGRRCVEAIPERDVQILADLGVTASSIAVTNAVIWVEGPSDAIYIRQWLAMHEKTRDCVEGVDFSFAFHAGALLAHFEIDSGSSGIVSFLALHPGFFLVADSDRRAADSEPKHEYLTRLRADPRLCGRLWVTQTKEIEGYVPDAALSDDCQRAGFEAAAFNRFSTLAERLISVGMSPSWAEKKVALARKVVDRIAKLGSRVVFSEFDLLARIEQVGAFISECRERIPPVAASSPAEHEAIPRPSSEG